MGADPFGGLESLEGGLNSCMHEAAPPFHFLDAPKCHSGSVPPIDKVAPSYLAIRKRRQSSLESPCGVLVKRFTKPRFLKALDTNILYRTPQLRTIYRNKHVRSILEELTILRRNRGPRGIYSPWIIVRRLPGRLPSPRQLEHRCTICGKIHQLTSMGPQEASYRLHPDCLLRRSRNYGALE